MVLFGFMIPALTSGQPAVWVAIVGSTAIMFVVLNLRVSRRRLSAPGSASGLYDDALQPACCPPSTTAAGSYGCVQRTWTLCCVLGSRGDKPHSETPAER